MLSKLQTLKEEREQGFTLIELLVVILIIGILSAIAIPAFMNQRKSAVDSSVQSDVSNAAKQIETAAVKAGSGIITLTGAGSTNVAGAGIVTLTPATGSTVMTPIVTQVSDGTVLTFTGNTRDGYTVKGTNAGGDVANTTAGFTYNSLTGGL